MVALTRTDIHRPSAIHPENYEFVDCVAIGGRNVGDFMGVMANAEAMKNVRRHMEMTGGKYSGHEHGGTCHVCGAHALYLAVFYHPETNTYIRTGEDCAAKMDMQQPEAFRHLRISVQNWREAKAGRAKAKHMLEEKGMPLAWEIYKKYSEHGTNDASADEYTVTDIMHNIVRYGHMSEKQEKFLRILINRINTRPEREAKWAAEKAAAAPCPTGRQEVFGMVLKTKIHDSNFGRTLKMTVKTDDGWVCWGTVPTDIGTVTEEVPMPGSPDKTWPRTRGLAHGDRIRFTATFTPSDNDPKFGFFKRPSKAEFLGKTEKSSN